MMSLWECQHRDAGTGKQCKSNAMGVGSAVGLRAIGWLVQWRGDLPFPDNYPIIKCPFHNSTMVAEQEAKQIQSTLIYSLYQGKFPVP